MSEGTGTMIREYNKYLMVIMMSHFEYFQQQLNLIQEGQQCEEEAEGFTARPMKNS